MSLSLHHGRMGPGALAVALALAALPTALAAAGQEYYVGFATRVLAMGLAATSLNLVLGVGGMVSFGHAAFVGAGAYVVAALMQAGVGTAWIAWPLAFLVSGLLAAGIGALALRTRGLYFIMVTLAYAQMVFYLVLSLKALGGDDGLALPARSTLEPGVSLAGDAALYYAALVVALVASALLARLVDSPFGRALQAVRENPERSEAIGFPVYRVQLVAFTIGGAVAGLAGALLVNVQGRAGPALLDWPQSGALLVMVILGGVGHRYGGFAGALLLLGMEEFLPERWAHWPFALAAVLLFVVLRAPGGIVAWLTPRPRA